MANHDETTVPMLVYRKSDHVVPGSIIGATTTGSSWPPKVSEDVIARFALPAFHNALNISKDMCWSRKLMVDSKLFHDIKLSIGKVASEIRRLYQIAFPLILAGVLTYGKSAISTVFLGRLGTDSLAGGSLALGFANITGYSLLSGLAMGMDAISSQAIGAKQWKLVGHTLRRTVVILCLFCLPISVLWLFVQPILCFLGQDPVIAAVAANYLRYCLPDIIIVSVLYALRIYLRTQKVTRPLMLGAGVSLAFHGPLNYLLVSYFDLGVGGVAMCIVLTDLNHLVTILVYLYVTGIHKQTWGQGWSLECLRGWPLILSLAVPNCISVCLEWWWYELMIVLSGILSNSEDAVATMGILIQATSLIYIFPSSLANAVSTRVGNELGAGEPDNARRSSAVSLCCAIVTSVAALAFAVTTRNVWGTIFTADESVVALTAAAMPLLGLCELGNCPQTTMCGALRGSARPKLGANINLGAFYGVGLPVAIGLGFWLGEGLLGLWMGLLAAQAACSLLMSVAMIRTDWLKEAERAKELTGGGGSDGVSSEAVAPLLKPPADLETGSWQSIV